MDIAVIGAGNMGRGVTKRMAVGGHSVFLADVDANKAVAVASEVGGGGHSGTVQVTSAREAATRCDVVVLATMFQQTTGVAVELSDVLAEKIVIEICNPLNDTFDGLVVDPTSSGVEEIARRIPGARVVKAFNTTFAPVLFDGNVDGTPLDVLLASDDEDAKRLVAELVVSGEMRPLDTGPLVSARTLERLTLMLIGMQFRHDLNFMSSLKLIPLELKSNHLLEAAAVA
jgi:NADPH-dependent F420 reductase